VAADDSWLAVDGWAKFGHALPMLVNAVISLHRAVLFTVLSMALIAIGFAHRMPSASDQTSAFALVNGATAADICGDAFPGRVQSGTGCLACQIGAAADLPPAPGDSLDLDLLVPVKVTDQRESRIVARAFDPSHAAQGPPSA
jgi:hypothetical protein